MSNKNNMKNSELRYRRVFETAQDGILLMDVKTGKIYDANKYLLELLKYDLEDLVDKRLWEIGLFNDREEAKRVFEVLQEKGYIRYEHLPIVCKDGTYVPVEFICNSYAVGNCKTIQCNIRDIRKRVESEKNLQKYVQNLEDLNILMVGREIRMSELKKEVRKLKKIEKELKAYIKTLH